MADRRLKALLYPPGGIGLATALTQAVKPGTVVTSLNDQVLKTAKQILLESGAIADHDDESIEFRTIGNMLKWISGMCGLPQKRRISPTQLTAMIMNAAKNLPAESDLCMAEKYVGTAEIIGTFITELHQSRISTGDLKIAAEKLPNPLSQKLRSLAEIEEALSESIQLMNGEFGADRATACINQSEVPPLPISHCVVIAGSQYLPLYWEWINWIAEQGVNLEVLIEDFDYSDRLGDTARQFLNRLNAPGEHISKPAWTQALFSSTTAENTPEIKIRSAPEALTECEAILRHCYDLIQDNVSPQKIAIFTRDANTYGPLLVTAAVRFGIKISLNFSIPLLSNGFACVALNIFKALTDPDPLKLIPALQSSYFNFNTEQFHIITTAIQGSTLQDDPAQYVLDQITQVDSLESLREIFEWFIQCREESKTAAEWREQFREFIQVSGILENSIGMPITQDRDLRAQTLIHKSLSEATLRLQGARLSLAEFINRLEEQWSMEQIAWNTTGQSGPETAPDAIPVCTSTSQLRGFEHLFVLGVLEGAMPRRRTENAILNDDDRNVLNQIFTDKAPLADSHLVAHAERDEFIRICGSASKSLHFSYPEVSDERDNIAAFYLQELVRAVPQISSVEKIENTLVPPLEDCRIFADIALRKIIDSEVIEPEFPQLHLEEAKQLVRHDIDVALTPEHVADAVDCPFRAAVKNKLQIYQSGQKRYQNLFKNTPRHAKLLEAQDYNSAKESLQSTINERLIRTRQRFKPWEVDLIHKFGQNMTPKWLDQEFEFRDFIDSSNYEIEVPGKLNGTSSEWSMKVKDEKYKFSTDFAAIYRNEKYVYGLIYQSSSPDLTAYNMWRENKRKTIVLALNLISLYKERPRIPRLVVDTRSGRKIYALRKFNQGRKTEFATIDAESLTDYKEFLDENKYNLSDNNALRLIVEKLETEIEPALKNIIAGNITPTPGKACEFCPYGELCRSHLQFGDRSPKWGTDK